MPYTIYQFGDLVLPQYNTVPDVGTGKFYTNFRDVPDGGVFDVQGSRRSMRKATPITKRCVIHAETAAAFRTAYRALRAKGGTRDRLWRLWDTGDAEWIWARMEEIPAQRERSMILHQEVTLQFVAISPYWHGTHHGGGWSLADPEEMVLGDGHLLGEDDVVTLTGSPQTITVTNGDDYCVPVIDAILIVTAGSAPITSLTITCGDCELQYTGTIAAGKELIIDSGGWAVTNDGADAFGASFVRTSNHTNIRWFELQPGDNDIVVTYTGGGIGSTFLCDFYNGEN